MASAGITVEIKISQLEPTNTYIDEMDVLVGYLRSKGNLSAVDKRIIESYDGWRDELFERMDKLNNIDEPSLEVIKGGQA